MNENNTSGDMERKPIPRSTDPANELIRCHIGVIKGVVLEFTDGTDEGRWQDLLSASMLGAAKAIDGLRNGYEPEHFVNYLRLCCRNAIRDELRRVNRWSVEVRFGDIDEVYSRAIDDADGYQFNTFEELVTSSADPTPGELSQPWGEPILNPEESCLQRERENELWKAIDGIMYDINDRQANILWNYLDDRKLSEQELAKKWNCNRRTITRDLTKILNLLKREML